MTKKVNRKTSNTKMLHTWSSLKRHFSLEDASNAVYVTLLQDENTQSELLLSFVSICLQNVHEFLLESHGGPTKSYRCVRVRL